MSLKFYITIESNSQKAFCPIVLYSNMAAVTSHENRYLTNKTVVTTDLRNCATTDNVITKLDDVFGFVMTLLPCAEFYIARKTH